MSERTVPSLVGDIGATNARFALADGAILRSARVLAVDDYSSLDAAIDAYLASEGLAAESRGGSRLHVAALAVASPVTGDQISFTNHPWTFSIRALRQRLKLERLVVINDFTANALAVPHLLARDRMAVGGGEIAEGAPIGVIGPGSGLGVGGLLRGETRWIPFPSEGGHVTMAPASERESAVLDLMRRRFDHVSAERVLSGPGLVNLYNALAELDGVPAKSYGPAQIADREIGERDPYCGEAIAMFCAMLGTIAGNLALTLGAGGGIFIAGGIVPRLGAAFAASPFRRRFEQKGRFSPYLAAIPSFVVTHPTPAFIGLANLLAAGYRDTRLSGMRFL
jgi:glucokinase